MRGTAMQYEGLKCLSNITKVGKLNVYTTRNAALRREWTPYKQLELQYFTLNAMSM